LNGVTVTVNGLAAPISFVEPGEIKFQIPYETAVGQAIIIVNNGLGPSAPFTAQIFAAAPVIISIENQDSLPNTANSPAVAGSTASVFLTGLGAVTPPVADGAAAPSFPVSTSLLTPVVAIVSGAFTPLTVTSVGLVPGQVGVAQVNFLVPGGLTFGNVDEFLEVTMNGQTSLTNQFFVYNPNPSTPLQITTTTLPVGSIGVPYSDVLTATGGAPPYSNWAIVSGSLPPGLFLNGSAITGAPSTTSGSPFRFSVTVQDEFGIISAPQTLSISVAAPVTISTASLPGGGIGVPYSQTLTAAGGAGSPYVWEAYGSLPPGLTLSTATGVISGTPTLIAGSPFSFYVIASDAAGRSSAKIAFSIAISSPFSVSPASLAFSAQPGPLTGSGTITISNQWFGSCNFQRVCVYLPIEPSFGMAERFSCFRRNWHTELNREL
jgi:uncharacterized protein (TIGR03437 family)